MKKQNKKKEISQEFKNVIAEYRDDLIEVLNGTSLAKYIAKEDKKKFDEFKNGNLVTDKEYDYKNMYILSILEGLGFPMDELGTYLYKEFILEVGNQLNELEDSSTVEQYNDLFDSVNNINSNLYSWVHSDYLEMGKKTFAMYLNQAFDKIDKTKVNKEISELLFGDEEQPDYAFQTIQLGMQALAYDKYSKKSPKVLGYLK